MRREINPPLAASGARTRYAPAGIFEAICFRRSSRRPSTMKVPSHGPSSFMNARQGRANYTIGSVREVAGLRARREGGAEGPMPPISMGTRPPLAREGEIT